MFYIDFIHLVLNKFQMRAFTRVFLICIFKIKNGLQDRVI